MGIVELFDSYWNENIDPRTKYLPLVSSNYLVPSILFAYLYFVLKCGPRYMKDKQAYKLKTFVRFYNIAQVIINGYFIRRFIALGVYDELKLCYVPDYSFEPVEVEIAFTLWLTFMSKVLDLVETVVFVLRKKNRQVSFLHLYHHIAIVMIGWYFTRFFAMRMSVFPIMVNCSVHVIMYSYYFFSSLDKPPKIVQMVKPYITIIQLVQFVLIMLYHLVTYIPSCPLPTSPANIQLINLTILFKLFYDFYQNTYTAQKKQKN